MRREDNNKQDNNKQDDVVDVVLSENNIEVANEKSVVAQNQAGGDGDVDVDTTSSSSSDNDDDESDNDDNLSEKTLDANENQSSAKAEAVQQSSNGSHPLQNNDNDGYVVVNRDEGKSSENITRVSSRPVEDKPDVPRDNIISSHRFPTTMFGSGSKPATAIPELRVVIVGPPRVGKTNLMRAFLGKPFSEQAQPTTGIHLTSKTVRNKAGQEVNIAMADIPSQKRLVPSSKDFYEQSDFIIFAYDASNLTNLSALNECVGDVLGAPDTAVKLLVGCKVDQIKDFSAEQPIDPSIGLIMGALGIFPAQHFFTSSKNNSNNNNNNSIGIADLFYRGIVNSDHANELVSGRLLGNTDNTYDDYVVLDSDERKSSRKITHVSNRPAEDKSYVSRNNIISTHRFPTMFGSGSQPVAAIPELRVVIVGPSGTGKTTLMHRYVSGRFVVDLESTISGEFMTRITNDSSNNAVKVSIADTAGQERFATLVRSYYRQSDFIILAYNAKSIDFSIAALEKWVKEVLDYAPKTAVKLLVGCQIDLLRDAGKDPTIDEKIKAIIKQLEITEDKHFFTSSKTGEGVEDLFARGVVNSEHANKLVEDQLLNFENDNPRPGGAPKAGCGC